MSIAVTSILDEALSLAGSATSPVASGDVELVRLGAIAGSGDVATGRAESISFDTVTDRAFTTNLAQGVIDITQVNADGSLVHAGSIDLNGLENYGGVNSVAVKNGIVAVAYQATTGLSNGRVALFDAANGALVKLIEVGVLPDQVTFSPDGSRLLVANEGEAVSNSENAAGSISIIDMSNGAAAAAVLNTIGFASVDGNEAALKAAGLALYPGQAASADIEPEYISISPDGTRAYVTLQEVNAVAVIDLSDPTADKPLSILPLGGIDRSLVGNAFDASDRDGISLENFDVISLPQPDAIASFAVGGVTYFVTANEGDARVGGNLLDEARLSSAGYVLDPVAYPDAAALKNNNALGRLNVITTAGDEDGDGDIDQITTYGGRGISIFRQNADGTIEKVRETGGEFEAIIATDYPALFNTENGADVDSRSDNKGPEPEGVTIGLVNDRTYAFVTLERVGGVMVYDVTDPENAAFVTYEPATSEDYAPEVVTFVSAADSPTGEALVLSANEFSGTLTAYGVIGKTIFGTEAGDKVQGTAGDDRIRGFAGDDKLVGQGGDDALHGGLGADRLLGGSGSDTASYANAASAVSADLGRARGDAGEAAGDLYSSIENLAGSAFDDTLEGGSGANIIQGGRGNDAIDGDTGNDGLFGDTGNDTIDGGAGRDTISGGTGADHFLFARHVDSGRTAAQADTIADFNAVQGDVIDISAIDANARVRGNDAFTFIDTAAFSKHAGELRYEVAGSDSYVSGDLNGDGKADFMIHLANVSSLAQADFLL